MIIHPAQSRVLAEHTGAGWRLPRVVLIGQDHAISESIERAVRERHDLRAVVRRMRSEQVFDESPGDALRVCELEVTGMLGQQRPRRTVWAGKRELAEIEFLDQADTATITAWLDSRSPEPEDRGAEPTSESEETPPE